MSDILGVGVGVGVGVAAGGLVKIGGCASVDNYIHDIFPLLN